MNFDINIIIHTYMTCIVNYSHTLRLMIYYSDKKYKSTELFYFEFIYLERMSEQK